MLLGETTGGNLIQENVGFSELTPAVLQAAWHRIGPVTFAGGGPATQPASPAHHRLLQAVV